MPVSIENFLRAVVDQERTAGKRDAAELVRLEPAAPQGARRVAEHRAAVEAL
ncbi:MAG: hypothetical protein QM756_17285 [Polyangiaceae bacterium]